MRVHVLSKDAFNFENKKKIFFDRINITNAVWGVLLYDLPSFIMLCCVFDNELEQAEGGVKKFL